MEEVLFYQVFNEILLQISTPTNKKDLKICVEPTWRWCIQNILKYTSNSFFFLFIPRTKLTFSCDKKFMA